MDKTVSIVDSRPPSFLSGEGNWSKWRTTYNGGEDFRDTYLERFSEREEMSDFVTRKAMTPIPTFAKAAINDVRNAIFQRMRDITRRGGSKSAGVSVPEHRLADDLAGWDAKREAPAWECRPGTARA